MAWRGPTPRPKQTLTWLRGEKGSKDGAAARFAGIGVTTAVNPTTRSSRNVAHLGEISSNRWVEKMEELEADLEALGGEARRRGEGVKSLRSSRRQWRRRFRQSERERGEVREWTGAEWVRGVVASMPTPTTWRAGPTPAYGRQLADRCRAGRPRRRARLWIRRRDHSLTELLRHRLSPKLERVRRWCSWQSWSTNWVLQYCQLEQEPDRTGLNDMEFPKSIEQTVCVPGLRKFSKCWKQP